jgi:hypothetical protein
MNGDNILDGLDLNNDLVIHDNVSPESNIYVDLIVYKRHIYLIGSCNSQLLQLIDERSFIDRFQQAGTEGAMNLDAKIDHDLGYFIFCQSVYSAAFLGVLGELCEKTALASSITCFSGTCFSSASFLQSSYSGVTVIISSPFLLILIRTVP